MGILNPFDETNLKILGEIKVYRDRAKAANPVKLGTERVSPSEFKKRLATLSPEERVKLFQKDQAKFMQMLGGT